MITVCRENQCTGCMACVDICPKDAISIRDALSAYNAEIDADKCIHCNLCHKICQNNTDVSLQSPVKWYQGWAEDENIRAGGSSGGVASALMLSFVEKGGHVCSCLFRNGQFVFEVADKKEDITAFKGSKYVKSNPRGAYKRVKELLKRGEKVLFIGLPCQVAALKIYVGDALAQNLYTTDLICHGTPSPQLLEKFLRQYGHTLQDMHDVQFRKKGKFQVRDGEKSVETAGINDSYLISFLNGICYTENCYSCKYAQFDRVSDITLGDSWGSELSEEEKNQGISLILCNSAKGEELLSSTALKLVDVNIERAVAHNGQLKSPSVKPASRDVFYREIEKEKKYNAIVFGLYPKQSVKQWTKKILIKMKLYKS